MANKRRALNDDLLVARYLAGVSSYAMARDYGTTGQTILNRLHERGVTIRGGGKRDASGAPERLLEGVEFDPFGGCWLWSEGCGKFGYGQLHFAGKKGTTHRLAYEVFVGPIPGGLQVLHKCDVRCCINPSHLFLGTNKDNRDDSVSKRRHAHGETSYAKLREVDVLAIRAFPRRRGLWAHLAKLYGVGEETITRAYDGRTWTHLPMPGAGR